MKKIKLLAALFITLLTAFPAGKIDYNNSWIAATAVYGYNKIVAMDIYRLLLGIQHSANDYNPGFFKSEFGAEWRDVLQQKSDDASLTPFSRRIQLSANLSMFSFCPNLDFKTHIFKEDKYGRFFPQITLGVNYWNTFFLDNALLLAADQLAKGNPTKGYELKAWAISPYFTLSKTISPTVKAFAGSKLTAGRAETRKPEPPVSTNTNSNVGFAEILSSLLPSIFSDSTFKLTSGEIFSGMTVLMPNNKESSTYMGFLFGRHPNGKKERELWLKSEITGKHWTWGVGFYPNNVIRIRPYVRLKFTW